jgi:hypothetical protein
MGKWTNNLFKLIMTPREKAWELYHKYRTLEGKWGDNVMYNYDAKQCALIAVDEMMIYSDFHLNYLDEVKTEIEKL